ncbi:DUF7009 family protein [Aequorivita echinoideorum]|uniref:SHSP domain-containing protein n=1 Tax=Aequorivita echinoideorum TaxID=1549647 RepID=A0ABS5S167_9FLAO|nr:hypothetical protein [Aequorivita echinoideorum]MBT0606723.1 hypothetical protein [Aequorivita echinoideorum]
MKIRIRDNSVRLRLTKTDIRNLRDNHLVSSKTEFSQVEIFEYELRSDTAYTEISAKFKEGKITIQIPLRDAEILTETEEITIRGTQNNGMDSQLSLLIEKDLECIDATDEDQSDMYENKKSIC